ncbi:unnamed protein product [Sphagnum balticum]
MFEILANITGTDFYDIAPSDNYSITLDNFFKMCLIVQRIKSKVPVVVMGETGVGKTALIAFLAENIYHDKLMRVNVNAGTTEKELKPRETELYIKAMLSRLNYRREDVVRVLVETHRMIQAWVEESAANLRDVFRFKTLFEWFFRNMPANPVD